MKKKSLPTVNIGMTLFISALSAFLLGAAIGVVYLVMTPVLRVDRAPLVAQRDPMSRVFVRGSELGGSQWRAKLARMMDVAATPRTVAFTEGDLNLFLKQSIERPTQRGDEVSVMPNIDISQGLLQLALVIYIPQRDAPIILQTQGPLEKVGNGYSYRPQTAYLGALPLPRWVAQMITDTMIKKAFSSPQAIGFKEVWASLSDAEVVGSQLRLSW